ncbi:MAG: glycosyltransferase, partial [Anaerolineae bacterium]|nr:glycosyltransferase [Anaerolineae bacterium]
MPAKHILFLTPQLPYPPHQGTALRNFGLIRGAAQAGHAVTLLSFWERGQPDPNQSPLARLCHEILTVPAPPPRRRIVRAIDLVFTGEADMARRLRATAFDIAIQRLFARKTFDAVQIEGIEMARYRPLIKTLQPNAGFIYDAHNAEFDLQRRVYEVARAEPKRWLGAAYSFVQWQRLMQFERETCRAVRYVLAVSQADAEALRALAGVPVTVIPNGIDVDAYVRSPADPEAVDLGPAALVFTGKMDYRPNVDAALWFADEVFPLIRAAHPEARFV